MFDQNLHFLFKKLQFWSNEEGKYWLPIQETKTDIEQGNASSNQDENPNPNQPQQ